MQGSHVYLRAWEAYAGSLTPEGLEVMVPAMQACASSHACASCVQGTRNVRAAMLTGSTRAKDRRPILQGLAEGDIDIVVGTHAVLQGSVAFKSLGVGVIDEQHRSAPHPPRL